MPVDETERQRRRKLLAAHYDAENGHDLPRVMATFAEGGEMHYNRQVFPDAASIEQAHAYMGFSAAGAFSGLRATRDREHFTDDEVVVEGRVCGTHTGEFQGFPPTGREVELPFVAFYRFDGAGKLRSERVVMNLGPLAAAPIWAPR
jgi:predicted ester cyclase